MARIKQTFSNELALKIATLPVFIRPHLADALVSLLAWVDSIEARVAQLEAPPAAPVATGLCAPAETAPQAAARIQAQIDRACGACDE